MSLGLDNLSQLGGTTRLLQLVKVSHGRIFTVLLIGDVPLVDFEGGIERQKELAPVLFVLRHGVDLFNADEKPPLEVEQCSEIEED